MSLLELRGLVLAWVCSGFALSAAALSPATLIDPQLQSRQVRVLSLEAGTLRLVDGERNFQELSTRDIVRLSFTDRSVEAYGPASETVATPRWLRLTDGQVIFGEFLSAEGDGEVLRWRHPQLGVFVVALDHVASITPTTPQAEPGALVGDDDRVTLMNGDALAGFVVAVDEDGLWLDTGADGEVVLPWSNIRELTLANPSEPSLEAVDVVTLTDGSVVRTGPVSFSTEGVTLAPRLSASATPGVEVPLERVAAVDFGASRLRLVPLMSAGMRVLESESVFGLSFPPRAGDGMIRLHAPMRLLLDLPGEATRWSATVELDVPADTPPSALALASVDLWVTSDDSDRLIAGFDAATPRAKFNEPIQTRRLELRLDPAANGPVLDRLVIRDGQLLLSIPPEPATGPDAVAP